MKKLILSLCMFTMIWSCSVEDVPESDSSLNVVRDQAGYILGMHKLVGREGNSYYRLLVCRENISEFSDAFLLNKDFCRNPFMKGKDEFLFGEIPERRLGQAVEGYVKGSIATIGVLFGTVSVGLGGGAIIGTGVAAVAPGTFAGAATAIGTAGFFGGAVGGSLGSVIAWVQNNIWGHGDRATFHHWDEIFSPMNEEDEISSAPKVDIKKVLEALGEELNVKPATFF